MKNLYQQLDSCTYILANNIESQLDFNEPLYEKLREVNEQEIAETKIEELEQYFTIDNNDTELKELIKNFKGKTVSELYEEMSEELTEEILELTYNLDYCEIYQTFHIDSNTAEILEDYNQIVWYNEELDAHFWGVTHYGTSWSMVMNNNFPIQNADRYKIND